MIEQIAKKITYALIEYKYILDLQKEEYIYTITVLIENWITIIVIMLLSICFHKMIPTLFFLFFLSALKKRCCGFHASSFKTCFFLTITTYIIFILFLMPIMKKELNITYILFGVSVGILEFIGAINHPSINWNKKEYKENKKAARICVAMEGFIISFLIFLNADSEIIIFMIFAIILNVLSLLIAKITNQEGFYEKRTSKNKNTASSQKDN